METIEKTTTERKSEIQLDRKRARESFEDSLLTYRDRLKSIRHEYAELERLDKTTEEKQSFQEACWDVERNMRTIDELYEIVKTELAE